MTRRKKTKPAANQNLNQSGATATVSVSSATGPRASTVHNASSVSNTGTNVPRRVTTSDPRSAVASSTSSHSFTSSATAPSSNSCSASTSSRISNATTSFSDKSSASTSKESRSKTSVKRDPKKTFKEIVKYETKQIYIQPKYPILTVERLPNLDNHVRVLTESIGWRPRVYQHGKGVRFVPESQEEYRIIQRYLAKIETEDRIAWCSYTLPPGNSLKVNIKVRVVETVEIENKLQKLQIQNTARPRQTK
ncbi:unnamed protein product [Parnassius apollo]|uniref:(apollo) hypothetical protein n=1 Tax=Parnassius apollo TaxID=110799 RepID=A0A8S3WGF1_PARAO|nr:unnamed protein product [Parnassius apollo]